MDRTIGMLRWLSITGLLAGIGFLLAPVRATVEPFSLTALTDSGAVPPITRSSADSLTEDIILYNLFSPTRRAPSRRSIAATSADAGGDEDAPTSMSNGFTPELIGTAVSDKPGETRALLRMLASDPTPRLYAVGEKAGGFTVVSIDARSVVLTGPRGRVVLRLPENEESDS